MVLHSFIPHFHVEEHDHKAYHGHHHDHGHSHYHHHHDEHDEEDSSNHEHEDNSISHWFAHHAHFHFEHKDAQLINPYKKNFKLKKHLVSGNLENFNLNRELIYDDDLNLPERESSHYHNVFLLNCSLRAPPSDVLA